MRKLFALTAVMAASVTTAMADPSGKWLTEEGETGGFAVVDISLCDDGSGSYCGEIVEIIDNENDSALGVTIITGMEDRGNGRYRGGRIYAPDQDQWYNSRMNIESDGTLAVYGCVAGGLICRGQTWTRVQ